MKNHLRKILSFILCLAMCLSLFPTAAFATGIDSDAGDGQTYVEPQEEPAALEPVDETPEAQPQPEPEVTPEPVVEPTAEPTDEPKPEATPTAEAVPEETPEPTAAPEITPEVTPDDAEEEVEDEEIMPLDLEEDTETTAEDTLRANLAAASAGGYVTLTESVTLTKNLTVPYEVILYINNGATLTIPNGITLTNNYHIFLRQGSKLVVEDGGVLANVLNGSVQPCIYLYGGVLTVAGTITAAAENSCVGVYESSRYTSLSEATNLTEDVMAYSGTITSGDSLNTVLMENWSDYFLKISGTINVVNYTSIFSNRTVGFYGGTVIVPSGVTFSNYGSLFLVDGCSLTIEEGGTFYGNAPQCDATSSFTDNGNIAQEVTSWAEFKSAVESNRTISINIIGDVTLEEDVVVPMDIPVSINGGSLTIPAGKSLTVGARLSLGNYSTGEGTGNTALTIAEGATLTLKDPTNAGGWVPVASVYVSAGTVTNNGTINLQTSDGAAVSGRPAVELYDGEYTGDKSIVKVGYSVADATEINTHLAEGYGYYVFITYTDKTIDVDMTIPTGVSVTIQADVAGTKATYTVAEGVTVTNNGTFTTNGDIVIENGGKWSGTAPTFTGEGTLTDNNSSTGADTTAEDTLCANLAAAASGDTVTLTESVTLTEDLTVPYGVTLEIDNGATLAVPDGITLTNQYLIFLMQGGNLIVDVGGVLTNKFDWQENVTTNPCVNLSGGVLTVYGSASVDTAEVEMDGAICIAGYFSRFYNSLDEATNLTADVVRYSGRPTNGDNIKTALGTNYYGWYFEISDSISIVDGTTIPANKIVGIGGGTVTVPAGVTFTNNGELSLYNGCTFTVEVGGIYIGDEPICNGTSTFINENNTENTLREAIAAAAETGGFVTVDKDVTLTSDLTVNAESGTLKLELAGGKLTIPAGVKLIIGNNAQLIFAGGTIEGEGTVALAAGAAANLDADKYAELDFATISGGMVDASNTEYFASFADEAELKKHLAASGFKSVDLVQADNTTVTLTADATIAEGTLVDVSDGSTLVVSGGAFTNNGTLQISGNGTFTVNSGAVFVNNGEYICDYYGIVNIGGAVSGTNSGAISVTAKTADELNTAINANVSSITIPNGSFITFERGSSFTIPAGVTIFEESGAHLFFLDDANFVNDGTLIVDGFVNAYEGSTVVNNGTINVTGSFVVHYGVEFNNNGTVDGAFVEVTGDVSTEEELLLALSECSLINLTNDVTITGRALVAGIQNDAGSVQASLIVPEGVTLTVANGGTLAFSYGQIAIFGNLVLESGARVENDNDNEMVLCGGVVTDKGATYALTKDDSDAVLPYRVFTSYYTGNTYTKALVGVPLDKVRMWMALDTETMSDSEATKAIKTELGKDYGELVASVKYLKLTEDVTIPADAKFRFNTGFGVDSLITIPSGVKLINNSATPIETNVSILVKEGGAIEGDVTCVNGAKITDLNEQTVSSYVTTEAELRLAIAAGVDGITVGADITIDGDLTIPENMSIYIGNATLTVNGTFETYTGGTIGEQAELIVNDLRVMGIEKDDVNYITLLTLDGGKLTVKGSYYTNATWIPFTIAVSAGSYTCGVNELFAMAISGNISNDNVKLDIDIATEDDIRTAIAAGFGGYSFYSAEGITEITLTSDLNLDGQNSFYQFIDCTIIVPEGVTLTIEEDAQMRLTHSAYSDSDEAPKLIIKEGGALVENGHLSLDNGATLVDENNGYKFDGVVDTEEDLRYVIGAGYDTVDIEGDITITEDIDITSALAIVSGGSLTVKKGVTVNLKDNISILTGGSMTVQSGAQVIYGEKQYDGWTRGVVIGLYGGKLVAPESSLVKDALSTPQNKIYIDTTAYDNTNRYTSALNGVSKSSVAGNFEVTSAKDITTALNVGYKYNNIVFVPTDEGDISISGAVTIPADRNVSFCAKNSEESDAAINFVSGSTLTNNGVLNILTTVNICEGAKYVSGTKAILNHNDLMNFIGDTSNACAHTWEMQSTEPATCDADGVRTDYCVRCDSTRTVTIPATGHNYKTVAAEPATCIAEGTYAYRICVNDCGSVYVKGADGKWGDKQYVETEDALKELITEPISEEHTYEVTAPTFYLDGAKVCSVCGTSIGVDEDGTLQAAIYRSDWNIPVNININTAGAPEGATVVGSSTAAYNDGIGLDLNALVSCDNVSDKDVVLAGWTVERSDGKVFFYEEGRLDGFYDADIYGISPTVVEDNFTFDATSFYDIINEVPTLDTNAPYTIDENGILCYENGEEYVSFTFNAVWVRNEKTLYFERWTTETAAINDDGSVNESETVAFPIAVPVDSITRGMSEPVFASEDELIRPTTNITGYTFSHWQVYLNWGDDYVGTVEVGTTINDLLADRELQDSDELVLRAVYVPSVTVDVAGVEGSWQLYADGTVVIDSFKDDGYKAYATEIKSIVLSEEITAIPDNAFKGFAALQSINIANVAAIGANAFAGCTLLGYIDLGSAVTDIGESAFANCKSLESVNFNSGIAYIGANAFKGSGIKSVDLELNTANAISDATGIFKDCTSLEYAHVSVAADNNTLPQSIFEGCTALTRVDISGFSGIGSMAFAGCTALTSVELYGVSEVYSYAFKNCTKLAAISFDSAMLGTIDDEGNFNNLGTIEANAFTGCNALKTVYLNGSAAQWTALKNSGNIGTEGNDKLIKATVKAQKDVTSVTVTNAPKYVGVGGTRTLTAKVAPTDAFPADVVWVFCDENGEIAYEHSDISPVIVYDAESLAQLNTVTGEISGLAEGTVYVMAIANGYQLDSTEDEARWVKSAVSAIEVRDYGLSGEDVIVLPDADNKAESRYWFEDYMADGGYAFALEGNDKAQLSANWNTSKDTKLAWSLDADDALYATISAAGLLTAKNVTSTVSVTVHVTTADGQSPVASREITIYPLPAGLNLHLKNVATDSGELAYNETAVNGQTVTLDIKDFKDGGKYADGLYLVAATGVRSSCPYYNLVAGDSASSILVYDENFAEVADDINVGGYTKGIVYKVMPVDPDAAIGKSVKWTINLTNRSKKNVVTQTVTFKFVDQVTALMSDADSYELYSGQKQTLKAYACDADGNATKLDKNGKPVAMTNKEVTWSIVSGTAYASVTAAGQLTASTVQDMQTVIARVALVENPDVYKDIEVTVFPLVTNIDILRLTADESGNTITEKVNDAKLYIDLNQPEELNFTARFTPEKSVWRQNSFTVKQSSGKIIDFVMNDDDTVTVKAKESNAVGTETITIAATDSGKVSAKGTITTGYFVNGITIDGYTYDSDAGNWLDDSGNIPTVKVGSKLTLKALAWNDAAATSSSKTGVSFALENAEDSAYATVSAAGVVTPKTIYGIRDVAIIATAKDVKATTTRIVVRVEPKETGILTIENELEENITKGTQLMDIGTETEPEMVRLFAIDLERDEYGNKVYPKVTWKSSNSSIASVDPDSGVVVANKVGTATITATVTDVARPNDTRTATVTIKVTRLVKEISLATDKNVEAVIASGKSLNLKATVTPTNASTKTVTWSIISGAEYATISTSGAVKANKGITEPQTIEVMAAAKDGGGAYSTMLIDILPETTGISILSGGNNVENTTVTMYAHADAAMNDVLRLVAATYPEGASNNVTWTSSNKNVVTVDEYGVVTAVKSGTANVTVKATDGTNKSASVKITVIQPIESIEIPREASLGAGKTLTFKAVISPTSVTNKNLVWSVKTLSGEMANCATISTSGALKANAVTSEHVVEVTVTAADGCGASASCLVVIKPLVTSVELYYGGEMVNGKQIDIIGGESLLINANNLPVVSTQGWTWKSGNEKIATVESTASGAVIKTTTEGQAGTVTITATASDGSNKSANFKVKVTQLVTDITLNVADGFTLAAGKSVTIKATTNTNASNKKVVWTFDDGSNQIGDVSISTSGVLKANATITEPTTVTVVCTSADGNCVKEVEAHIYPAATKVNILSYYGEDVTGKTLDLPTTEEGIYFAAITDPDEASNAVTWKTGNANIATVAVDDDGNAMVIPTGTKTGTVTITATTTDGTNKSANVKVKVYVPVSEINITPPAAMQTEGNSAFIAAGKSMTLKATTNSDATTKKVTWSVDCDSTVATINANGVLATKATAEEGWIRVTATATDGSGVYAEFDVYIKTPTTKLYIYDVYGETNITGTTVNLATYDTLDLTSVAELGDEEAGEWATWKSSNANIATVVGYGYSATVIPTGTKTGTVTITATTVDGTNKSATVKVNVYTPVESISIYAPNMVGDIATIGAGKSMTLKADVTGAEGLTPTNKAVTWSVLEGEEYISVNASSGALSVKSAAMKTVEEDYVEATVKAAAKDISGVESNELTVRVYKTLAQKVTVEKGEGMISTTLDIGETAQLKAIAYSDAKGTTVLDEAPIAWTSSNESIATVDEYGTVTALSSGYVTITATSADGNNKSGSIALTVVK